MAKTHSLSETPHLSRSDIGRFFSKVRVDPETGCWIWTSYTVNRGYGQFKLNKKMVLAHRLMYAWLVRPLPSPDELELHHTCNTPRCCNPSHLELIDHKTHMLKSPGAASHNASKTHCPNGHPLQFYNGRRYCPICKKNHEDNYRQQNKERIKAQQQNYRQQNKKQKQSYNRKYYQQNKERIKAQNEAYRQKNKEHLKAKEREHRHRNKNKPTD